MEIDKNFMKRALQLARCGEGNTWSNPMVGAVITSADGRIIGEGYHRQYGKGHAEVNAVASVKDKSLLRDSTMYVTLEPCSHYGKTPPCAGLIIDCGIPRVVVGASDPFKEVSGRGIAMLRGAGVEVVTGIMEKESRQLNAQFITAHTLGRPFITLKWAQTYDGYMGAEGHRPLCISTPLSSVAVHALRSRHQAIMVGAGTVAADNPRLDKRLWNTGSLPMRIVADRRGLTDANSAVFTQSGGQTLYITSRHRDDLPTGTRQLIVPEGEPVTGMMQMLYSEGIISVLVEGGRQILDAFIEAGMWDMARIETAPWTYGIHAGGVLAPAIQQAPASCCTIDGNIVNTYIKNPLIDVKNL